MLRKDNASGSYIFCAEESYPPHVPRATRNIWVAKKSKKASDETEHKLELLKSFRRKHEWDMLWKHRTSPECDIEETHCYEGKEVESTGVVLEIDQAIDELHNRRMAECSDTYHVNSYLTLPQPRTEQWDLLHGRLF